LLQVFKIFVKSFEKNYNIIDINFCILIMLSKKTIYLILYIDKRIFVFYYYYIEEFLFFVTNNNKTILIIKINALLIEEYRAVNYCNILIV